MKRGGAAKKMMRGGMAEKPMMMKAGGTPIKGGKVKKMRAGGGNMSSRSLRERVTDDSIARERNLSDMYRDRGTVGDRAFDKEFDRELREYAKDIRLIELTAEMRQTLVPSIPVAQLAVPSRRCRRAAS
jgi:hypothetical protein